MISATPILKVNGVDITDEIIVSSDRALALASAEAEQVKLMQAEKNLTNGVRKNLSFGRIRMKLCEPVYNFWTKYLGEECWQDESFKKWLEKRHGSLVQIKSISDKIMVGK